LIAAFPVTGGGSIGKSHFKEGSLSSPTVHTDTSVVIIYNGFRDGEAKPGVAGTSYPSLIHPVKALKNMREINLFDPRSIVAHNKDHFITLDSSRHHNIATMLVGIGE